MYNDNNEFERPISRPRFDPKTGEKIVYDDQAESQNETATYEQGAQSQTDASLTYRYSGQNIPFGTTTGSNYSYGATGTTGTNYSYGAADTMGGTAYSTGTADMTGAQEKETKKKKEKKEKKPAGFAKKALRFVAGAILFGAIAGGTMYGAYYAGYKIAPVKNNNYEIATVSSSLAEATANAADVQANLLLSSSTMNVEAVAQAALPAMVALSGTTTVSSSSGGYSFGIGGSQTYEATTSGTGIIVGKNDTELLILTNAHVIEDVSNLSCLFVDNESVSATVKGSKSDQDIAVVAVNLSDIKSSTLSSIAIAELGDSSSVVLGQEVVAIGNALGEGQSVTNGIISAMDRSITVNNVTFSGLMMTNAAINSGNSGGALLNADGKVIAINFAKTSTTGVEGMAYSIPVSNVSDLISSLMTKETRTKVSDSEASYLGVSGVDVTASVAAQYGYPQGLMLNNVASGSAAEKAGLAKYDIIVGFDDQTISSLTGLQSTMQYYKAGETVKIDYYHIEGNEYVLKSTEVTLGKKN